MLVFLARLLYEMTVRSNRVGPYIRQPEVWFEFDRVSSRIVVHVMIEFPTGAGIT